MYINLKDFILLKGYCGELNYDFARNFGNKMELTPNNIKLLLKQSDTIEAIDFVFEHLNEDVYKKLAIYLGVSFCKRCWNSCPDDVIEDTKDKIYNFNMTRQYKFLVEILPYIMKVSRQ